MTTTVVNLKDKDMKMVKLPYGSYMVDGKRVDAKSNEFVPVKDINSITKISETVVASHYTHVDDSNVILTVSEFEDRKVELESKGSYDEFDGFEFTDLDDEYNYKKFLRSWNRITKTIQVESDPLKVAVVDTMLDTGNPFITSMFASGDGTNDVFVYDRKSAVLEIVRKKFTELGMTYEEGINYGVTERSKVWGNSTHSVIRYVVAFGTYIFGDKWNIKHNPRGTFEHLSEMYESDKRELENIIETGYQLKFGDVDVNKLDISGVYKNLKTLRNVIGSIDSKVVTQDEHSRATKYINDIIREFEDVVKEG